MLWIIQNAEIALLVMIWHLSNRGLDSSVLKQAKQREQQVR
jgi:hypothetical protein